MGKSMNLNNLTPEEAEQILKVIQKDFELRQKEKERLSKIEEVIQEEETKTSILTKQQNFNENCCIRCCSTFGLIFNRKQTCRVCHLFVCKSCSQYDDHIKGYVCKACLKEEELKLKSFDWFYSNVSQKFKRFGSAKVVRTLYKNHGSRSGKAHSDNESDSGYDPSLYSSFSQSGSLRKKSRPSLLSIFPDISVSDRLDNEELDNGIPPPPIPFNGNFTTQGPPPKTPTDTDNKEKDKRDIYREAFESTKRTEEAKFKLRFNNILSEMQAACEKQSPRDNNMPPEFGSASYGEVMTSYRARIRDLLVSLSQRLELAVESFDESSPHSVLGTSQKVRIMVSKLIEDRLGESLDLQTSDEAVSDLSSLSDESGEFKSFEDQLAQAVVARMLELHRKEYGIHLQLQDGTEPMDQQTDSSTSEEKMADRTMSSSTSEEKHVLDSVQSETKEKNNNHVEEGQGLEVDEPDGLAEQPESPVEEPEENVESDKEDDVVIVRREFEKLKSFAMEMTPRPLYEEVQMNEDVEEEPIDEAFDKTVVDHEESQNEFSSRFYTYDRVLDPENRTDFSDLDYEYHDFGINEVDPDLLSMNLAPIMEETEEELEEDKENDSEYERDWRGNWIFQGGAGMTPYDAMEKKKTTSMELGDIYKGIPHEGEEYVPQIGNRDADQTSDLSENDDRDSLDGLSDEENSFYAKTSEEIARITRTTSRQASTSAQTDDSDLESVSRHNLSSSTDSAKHDLGRIDNKPVETVRKKLSEELIPSAEDDPKFEIPPDSMTVPEGEPVKFMCRVAGSPPLEVQWYRVTEDIEQLEESEKYEITQDGNRQYITMFNLTQEDAGQYMCIAVNDKGRCCQYFIVTLKKNTQETKKPEFLKSIADIEVQEGESVKFRCKVKGYPQPRVVWYKDGQILKKGINYRLERFGNRDYILAIDSASMDEDAEYSVVAKNIAGEVRSSAQLIVEPKQKPESPAQPKSPSSQKPTSPRAEPAIRIPTWSRSRAGVSLSSRKQEQNLSNLSQKVSMTKDSVTKEAEDMLTSTKELTEINKSIAAMDKILADLESDIYSSVDCDDIENNNDVVMSLGDISEFETIENYRVMKDAAENIRKVTSTAMDILNSTDSVLGNTSAGDHGILATSTPRSSDTEGMPSHSKFSEKLPQIDYENNLLSPSSEDEKHKTEFSFSFAPKNQNAQKKDTEASSEDKKQTSVSGASSQPIRTENNDTISASVKHSQTGPNSRTRVMSDTSLSAPQIDTDSSLDVEDFGVQSQDDGSLSEPLRINLGPKRENKARHTRDFYVTNTPMPVRRNSQKSEDEKEKPLSPVSSPRALEQKEKERAHTEEKIYLAAASVNTLESNVMSLHDKIRAVDALAQQDKMSTLEDQVARTVAKVATAEKDVKSIEKKVHKLNEPKPRVDISVTKQTVIKTRHAPKAPAVTMTTTPEPKPEPTNLRGHTSEMDLPESRTEFNEDYGAIELPSVNRLKAMFNQSGSHDSKDSSIKRPQDLTVHSITARSVPKEQLERLKRSEEPPTSLTSQTKVTLTIPDDHPVSPGRATVLTTGQQIKQTPSTPKQVFQSSDVKDTPQSMKKQQPMKITLSTANTNRPLSPVQSDPRSSHSSSHQPIRAHNPAKQAAPKGPSQAQAPSDVAKSGAEIDTPEGRKSPKIKSGAISAMSKFWEKRSKGEAKDEAYPDLLEN